MLQRVLARSQAVVADKLVVAMLLAGAALNGFAVRMVEAWQLTGTASPLLGISPFEAIAVLVGLALILDPEASIGRLRYWPEALLGLALLLPSSTISWAALGAYALYLTLTGGGKLRTGALLFVLLSASSLWSSVVLRWFAEPITIVEAHAILAFIAPFRNDITVIGNVIGIPGGHQVILLAACSSASILPKVLLGLFAVAAYVGNTAQAPLAWLAALLVIVVTLANWVRLAVMSLSSEMFEIAHGPIGANLFDMVQSALIIAAGLILCRR